MNKSIKIIIIFDTEAALPRIYLDETTKEVPKDLTASSFLLPSFTVGRKPEALHPCNRLTKWLQSLWSETLHIHTWYIASRKLCQGFLVTGP